MNRDIPDHCMGEPNYHEDRLRADEDRQRPVEPTLADRLRASIRAGLPTMRDHLEAQARGDHDE